MPHTDGPLYHPAVAILSLGAPAVIRFWRRPEEGGAVQPGSQAPEASLLLMPRSLLLFSGEAYSDCLHGILEVGCWGRRGRGWHRRGGRAQAGRCTACGAHCSSRCGVC
jgi:hypothetical protein